MTECVFVCVSLNCHWTQVPCYFPTWDLTLSILLIGMPSPSLAFVNLHMPLTFTKHDKNIPLPAQFKWGLLLAPVQFPDCHDTLGGTDGSKNPIHEDPPWKFAGSGKKEITQPDCGEEWCSVRALGGTDIECSLMCKLWRETIAREGQIYKDREN